MTEALLNVKGLDQFYGASHILWDLDVEVHRGECLCVMGRNGVGKTTLLKCVMGLIPSTSSALSLGDTPLASMRADARARAGIGYVPQGRDIFATLTVEENLRLALTVMGKPRGELPPRIFDLFPVLGEMLGRRGGDLSGGQQQQLAIARALVLEPRLLLLDEPTEGIQPNVVTQIGEVIRKLNREDGLTVLLVEQKLAFARRVGDRFTVLDKGRVVVSGDMDELTDEVAARHLSV